MKKLLFLSIFAVVTAISWVACSKEEVKAPTNSINEAYAKSEIKAIEDNLGKPISRQIKTISDDKGNSVTLQIASSKPEVLQSYLDNMKIGLVILESPLQTPVASETKNTAETKPDMDFASGTDGIMLEVLDKKFGKDTKAFTLEFRGTPTSLDPEARSSWEFESSLFIEGFQITYYGLCQPSNCCNTLTVQHWTRSCALCSYKLFATKSMNPGEYWESCNDGRRTKAVLSGSLPQSAYNYNFVFWNCA